MDLVSAFQACSRVTHNASQAGAGCFMKYANGEDVVAGDLVSFGNGLTGTVVCCLDTRGSKPGLSFEDWAYLEHGVMIDSPELGLLHHPEDIAVFKLLRREMPEQPGSLLGIEAGARQRPQEGGFEVLATPSLTLSRRALKP